jgi:hypothetical protein
MQSLIFRRLTAAARCAAIRGVPEYDAFGREIGDDPLAALRASVNPAPAKPERKPQPEPEPAAVEAVVPESEPPAPVVAAPPQRPQFVRPRRRRRGGVARLLVVVAFVAAIGLVTNSAVEKGTDIIKRITPDEAAPAAGLQRASLIRHDNFAVAMKKLIAADLGRPTSLRIAPDRIDATLLKGDKVHIVRVTQGGELQEFGFAQSSGTERAVAYAAIDPAAPERLTRAGATRKRPARSINYVLLLPGKPLTWGAYYKRGTVIGDRHGRPQRVI